MARLFAVIVIASLLTLLSAVLFAYLLYRDTRHQLNDLVHLETQHLLAAQEKSNQQLADANATSAERRQQAKFLLGAVSVRRGQALLKAGGETRNCQMVKQASEQFAIAQVNVPAGGRFAPQAAGQLMQALGQLMPAAAQTEKAICK